MNLSAFSYVTHKRIHIHIILCRRQQNFITEIPLVIFTEKKNNKEIRIFFLIKENAANEL
jgi:hypothetical protein